MTESRLSSGETKAALSGLSTSQIVVMNSNQTATAGGSLIQQAAAPKLSNYTQSVQY